MGNTTSPKPTVTPEQAQEALVALAKIAEQEGPKRKRRSQVLFKTPWNPTGTKKRPTLSRKTLLNDYRLKDQTLSTEEILLLNRLQPGKYRGGKWIVTVTEEANGPVLRVYLPNKTQDDRLQRAQIAGERGLAAILEKMVAEFETSPTPAPVPVTA